MTGATKTALSGMLTTSRYPTQRWEEFSEPSVYRVVDSVSALRGADGIRFRLREVRGIHTTQWFAYRQRGSRYEGLEMLMLRMPERVMVDGEPPGPGVQRAVSGRHIEMQFDGGAVAKFEAGDELVYEKGFGWRREGAAEAREERREWFRDQVRGLPEAAGAL